jgi:hypothetical protein
MSPSRKKSIWMGEPLERLIASRRRTQDDEVNVSGAINTAVDRYLEILRRSMPTLPLGEWCALFDALNGCWMLESWSPRYAFADVADTPGLGQKWQIDQDALVARLQACDYATCVAVVDAAERFWASEAQPTEEGWRSVIAPIVGKDHLLD